jgi:hypothetical protein
LSSSLRTVQPCKRAGRIHRAADRFINGGLTDVCCRLTQARQTDLQQAGLEDKRKEMFNALEPEMEFLRRMRERMGERYPEAMFLPPVLVDDSEKDRMIRAMRVSSSRIAATLCVCVCVCVYMCVCEYVCVYACCHNVHAPPDVHRLSSVIPGS